CWTDLPEGSRERTGYGVNQGLEKWSHGAKGRPDDTAEGGSELVKNLPEPTDGALRRRGASDLGKRVRDGTQRSSRAGAHLGGGTEDVLEDRANVLEPFPEGLEPIDGATDSALQTAGLQSLGDPF